MKYYVMETTMIPNAYRQAGFREALAGHMAFVKQQFSQGFVLFSGTKLDNSGGVRVLKIADDESVEPYWQGDPMAVAGMLDYRVTAFNPLDLSEGLAVWFK